MGHLGRGVTAEVADTEGAGVGLGRQLLGAHSLTLGVHLAVVPVLAEKAVEAASAIENGQVDVSVLSVPLADPIGHTVGREWVVVPVQDAFRGDPGQVYQLALLVFPQPAKAPLALGDAAVVDAQGATYAIGLVRRFRGQIELTTRFSLHFLEIWQYLCGMRTDAINAGANGGGDQRRCLVANRAFDFKL